MRKISIGLITNCDVNDKHAWSGLPFSIYNQIKQNYEVTVLKVTDPVLITKIETFKQYLVEKIKKKKYFIQFTKSYAKAASKNITKKLRKKKPDLILSLGNSWAVSFLDTSIPVIYLCDAVFTAMLGYYWFDLWQNCIDSGNQIEKQALEKASQVIFASDWAKKYAVDYYGQNPNKLHTICLGANLEGKVQAVERIHSKKITLLFIGVDWDRKGGDIAVDCVRYLNAADKEHEYELKIVGAIPPFEWKDKYIKVEGFINKNSMEGSKSFQQIIAQCDFFLLPTKAECAGMVFCEASAYGLPIFTYDTGGVSNYVINDVNGYRLPIGSNGKGFAEQIMKVVNDSEKWEQLKNGAMTLYQTELNWDVWKKKFDGIINKVIESK